MMTFLKAAVGALGLAAATGAAASPLSTWVDSVNKRIDALVVAPDFTAPDGGQIVVRFNLGGDGRATNVQFVRGVRGLTRTAARTLSRIGALPPLPVGYDATTPIAMNLMSGSPSALGREEGTRFHHAVAAALASAERINATVEQAHASQLALTETPR